MPELSFAVSAGEGTLLAYGTGTANDLDGILGSIDYSYEAQGEDMSDHVTVICGPADGTGE